MVSSAISALITSGKATCSSWIFQESSPSKHEFFRRVFSSGSASSLPGYSSRDEKSRYIFRSKGFLQGVSFKRFDCHISSLQCPWSSSSSPLLSHHQMSSCNLLIAANSRKSEHIMDPLMMCRLV
uniref:Uncharacterized protein n=1 Tax=Arundo donax TaxID=35708 RepID=A0A0A9H9G1_ARUDO